MQNMMISFTDYRNDYLKRMQFRNMTNEAKVLYGILVGSQAPYQTPMVMHGEMNMELPISFSQSKKL